MGNTNAWGNGRQHGQLQAQPTNALAGVVLAGLCLVSAPVALSAVGFSAAGPVAGSIAAGAMSTLGSTWVIAAAQSLTMGGYATSTITAGIATGAAIGAIARSKKQKNDEE